jgi:hypothetical protein
VQSWNDQHEEHPMPAFPIVTLKPEPFAYITMTTPMSDIAQAMGQGFDRLGAAFGQSGARMAGMPMCHYTAYDEKTTTFELGFPARPDELDKLKAAGLQTGQTPSGRNMKAVHMGPYDTVVQTYNAMTEEMKARGLTAAQDMWEVYYSPPDSPPEQIKTEILWPVQ